MNKKKAHFTQYIFAASVTYNLGTLMGCGGVERAVSCCNKNYSLIFYNYHNFCHKFDR